MRRLFYTAVGTLLAWGSASVGFALVVWLLGSRTDGLSYINLSFPTLGQVWVSIVCAMLAVGILRLAWTAPLYEIVRSRDPWTKKISLEISKREDF